ncbi:RdgB/HAM1 family non-canonical purine NTP pyrophosphatase [uncultured Anaerococcus sp.]|uniref:RdgB/HAM1 family non-canonical purine NTP pyrophosphatase n=1 Tax=uncultured Anaerococcus sp. TaxID=293428 RepID=UPI00260FF72F|nr:RdgB/HAM1 family non-canonical purine NTP pyrophosphatase [uncultured Anaerococcus sp.]
MELLFASNNINKLEQVKLLLDHENVLLPKDIGIEGFDPIEDGNTLKENAYKKALELYKLTGKKVFSDDTGLFVKSLDGRPGLYSHRYAGNNASDKDNRDKLLSELEDEFDRQAYFLTVVCFIDENGKDYYFEGRLDGRIADKEYGTGGFGYDRIFYVDEFSKTLGQMDIEFKNTISHRAKAVEEFKKFLVNTYENLNN